MEYQPTENHSLSSIISSETKIPKSQIFSTLSTRKNRCFPNTGCNSTNISTSLEKEKATHQKKGSCDFIQPQATKDYVTNGKNNPFASSPLDNEDTRRQSFDYVKYIFKPKRNFQLRSESFTNTPPPMKITQSAPNLQSSSIQKQVKPQVKQINICNWQSSDCSIPRSSLFTRSSRDSINTDISYSSKRSSLNINDTDERRDSYDFTQQQDFWTNQFTNKLNISPDIQTTLEQLTTKTNTGKYLLASEIGSGRFSKVFRAIDQHCSKVKTCAIKVIDFSSLESLDYMASEVEILKSIEHKNVISLLDLFKEETKLYIVSEMLYGGSLFDRVSENGLLEEWETRKVIHDLVSGVQYLHQHRIVHRDIKLQNILFESCKFSAQLGRKQYGRLKLVDFGFAKFLEQKQDLNTICGTLLFAAPEMIAGEDYNASIDMWSVGVVMYICLCGYPPFIGENILQITKALKNTEVSFLDVRWKKISSPAKELLKMLLEKESTKRIRATECLNHNWFSMAS